MNEIERINKILNQHLGVIVDDCKEALPELTAIILYGSYSHGEGSWIQETDGCWRPYNDYDILIVTERMLAHKTLSEFKKSLAKKIGIQWVDLSQVHPAKLKRLKPSILNYDLKYVSKVIYGDINILKLIPEFSKSSIPMIEIQTLYFTRLYTLIGSLGEHGLESDLEGDDSRFFRNQMAKAILAIVDVLLLMRYSYDPSYRLRVERVAELYPKKEKFLELSRWALNEKLRPQALKMEAKAVKELYDDVCEYYFSEMHRGLSKHYSRCVSGPRDIERFVKWLPLNVLKRLYWICRFCGFKMEKRIAVMLAQSYVASAYYYGRTGEDYLLCGNELLQKVDPKLPSEMGWNQARLQAARLRMEFT